MVRYLLYISYIGTRYRGAQKSVKNGPILDPDSIQGALECALLSIYPPCTERPTVTLSSRTDAGVHALKSAVHADLVNAQNRIYEPESLISHMNRYMAKCDHDIRVLGCIPVTDNFHARFRAISRSYMYRIIVPKKINEHRIPILERNYSNFIRCENFDIEKVKAGLQHFQGIKNFETFASKGKSRDDKEIIYVRKLHRFTVEEDKPFLPCDPLSNNFKFYTFHCKAKSFLYNQIRRMVGSLVSLGCGILTEKELRVMIEVPSSKSWNPKATTASPYGLYLTNVEYDEQELESYKLYPEENQEYVMINKRK